MSKERYHANKERVFTIYGVDPKDPKYNCHHICDKAHAKRGEVFEDMDINEKGNLIPLLKTVHAALHKKIDAMDKTKPKRKKKGRRGKKRRK